MYLLSLFFGAHTGIQARYNIIGITLCSFLTALGGGTIRSLLLDTSPPYFHDFAYILLFLLGLGFALSSKRYFKRLKNPMLILDALGMVVFAYIGALAAVHAHLNLAIAVGFAFLTAYGGGIIANNFAKQTPQVFRNLSYALPAIVTGLGVGLLGIVANNISVALLLLFSMFVFRVATIYASPLRRWCRGGYARTKQIVAFSFK